MGSTWQAPKYYSAISQHSVTFNDCRFKMFQVTLMRSLRFSQYCIAAAVLMLISLPLRAADDAKPLPELSISVLQFGTAHWELEHIQRQGLDAVAGFDLKIRAVANLSASRLAVSAGDVEGAVADLLWAQSRYQDGSPYRYVPFSSQIGDIVSADPSIETLEDLKGKRLGIAGGPDSKGWILLNEVATRQDIDLSKETEAVYAAPPLLSVSLERDQIDVLLTYWHFAARLKGTGKAHTVIAMTDLLDALSLSRDLPVLGYVFQDDWAAQNPDLLERFSQALGKAKVQLKQSPQHWDALRPLMRADSDATFNNLRDGFVAGMPAPLDDQRIADLQQLLIMTGTNPDQVMPDRLFYRSSMEQTL
jgi:NitT/TauT family transport system substrate-binding protein